MLGGVLGAVLSPVLAHLWNTYSDAYTTYGRLYFLTLPSELLASTPCASCVEAGRGRWRGGGSGCLWSACGWR